MRKSDQLAMLFGAATIVYMLFTEGIVDENLDLAEGKTLEDVNEILLRKLGSHQYNNLARLQEDLDWLKAGCSLSVEDCQPKKERKTIDLAYLYLVDGMKNKKTLRCQLVDGKVTYWMIGGHGDSGQSFAVSNTQSKLPYEKLSPRETVKQFRQRVIDAVNQGVYRVVHVVEPVEF